MFCEIVLDDIGIKQTCNKSKTWEPTECPRKQFHLGFNIYLKEYIKFSSYILFSVYFRNTEPFLTYNIDPEIFLVQYRGVHNEVISDDRFMGNKYSKWVRG